MKPKIHPLHFTVDSVLRFARDFGVDLYDPKSLNIAALFDAVCFGLIDGGMSKGDADALARKIVFAHGPSAARYQITEAIHRLAKRVADDE